MCTALDCAQVSVIMTWSDCRALSKIVYTGFIKMASGPILSLSVDRCTPELHVSLFLFKQQQFLIMNLGGADRRLYD